MARMRDARFPITLVFPPQGHFTQPHLALPCLKAWLGAHGFDDVEQVDASIESYDHFLSAEVLAGAAERVRETLPLERFAAQRELAFGDLEAFRAAAESAVGADAIVARVEEAKRVVRGAAFYDEDRYLPAMRTLYHGLRLFSAAHFPTRLTPHNFTMRRSNDRSAEVLAALEDEAENPYVAWFRERLLPRLVARRPKLVGMSVIYGSQLVPALTLGRLVKEALPDCHVTAGGGFLAYIGKKLLRAPGIERSLDSLVFHEGEAPLLGLARALREHEEALRRADARPSDGHVARASAGGSRGPAGERDRTLDLSGIGSLDWYDRSGGTARVVENASGHPIRLEDAPVPDFDGLPRELYFSPELVLPYDINRGCYYGECTFCTLPTVIGPGYRTRSAAKIVDQVLELAERHGTRNVNFITDCMPPGMIRDLPDELVRREANLRWWADARVEPKAYTREGARNLYASGCRKLLFGFETATPRLLKLMKKGQSARATLEVAANCTDAGISVTFYAMVGFPTETREEARETLAFLIENRDVVREVSLQTFHLDEVAATYREPEAFAIEVLDDPAADLQLYHDYRAASGMTQAEAAEMFEEMMAALREHLPLFSGDNILFFMNKSHYFLHLARGVTPDAFAHACRERERRRAECAGSDALAPKRGIGTLELPFSYTAAVRALAHPLARAVRPDFLTGRFVEGLEREAEAAIGALEREPCVLAHVPEDAQFCELTPDGALVLDTLAAQGSLCALLDSLEGASETTRASLVAFAARLARAGVLASPKKTSAAQNDERTTPLLSPTSLHS